MPARHRLIQAYNGWRPILRPPEEPVLAPDGASIVVHIRPPGEDVPSATTTHPLDSLWYDEPKRPLFLNRAIPEKGRLQLYNSLVASRLMYGCAVWTDVSAAQLKQLEAFFVDHQCRIANIGFWNGATMNDDDFRHHLEVPSFRVTWACHRLIYLQHISKHSSEHHRQALLLEFALNKGWLFRSFPLLAAIID